MKRESSSDVPILVIIPWRRKLEHWIGLKVTYFKTDFTRRIPFSLEQKKRRSSTLVHLIKILHESVQNGKVSLFFFFLKFVFVFALAKKRFENGC